MSIQFASATNSNELRVTTLSSLENQNPDLPYIEIGITTLIVSYVGAEFPPDYAMPGFVIFLSQVGSDHASNFLL